MEDLQDAIIKNLKPIVFSLKNKKGKHKYFQESLVYFFRELGFNTWYEYKLSCLWRPRRKVDPEELYKLRTGRIDVYTQYKNNFEIAIEFDPGRHVKMKSLEKLYQCNAKLCIAIIFDEKEITESIKKENIKNNVRRFKQIFHELKNYFEEKNDLQKIHLLGSKQMWLGIINYHILDKIKNLNSPD